MNIFIKFAHLLMNVLVFVTMPNCLRSERWWICQALFSLSTVDNYNYVWQWNQRAVRSEEIFLWLWSVWYQSTVRSTGIVYNISTFKSLNNQRIHWEPTMNPVLIDHLCWKTNETLTQAWSTILQWFSLHLILPPCYMRQIQSQFIQTIIQKLLKSNNFVLIFVWSFQTTIAYKILHH